MFISSHLCHAYFLNIKIPNGVILTTSLVIIDISVSRGLEKKNRS